MARCAAASCPERWLGKPEPPTTSPTGARSKYKRFIDAAGGWAAFQALLAAAHDDRPQAWRLDLQCRDALGAGADSVAAVIIGARLGESEHRADNLKAFAFALDAEDHARLDARLRRA